MRILHFILLTIGLLLAGNIAAGARTASADEKIVSSDGAREEATRDFTGGFLTSSFWVKFARSGTHCEATTYYAPFMPGDAMKYLPTVNPNGTINVLPGGVNSNICPPW